MRVFEGSSRAHSQRRPRPARANGPRLCGRRPLRRALTLCLGIVLGCVMNPTGMALDASSAAGDGSEGTGLWPTTFEAGQVAADCGRWRLDDNGFCVADDVRNGLELGVRFQASRAVRITGIRMYRYDAAELRASLWDSHGRLLAHGRFADGPISAWQDMRFAQPVTIEPGETYTASYFTPRARYGFRYGYFASSALSVGPITALRSTATAPNGVFRYVDAPTGAFPVRSYRSSSYWVSPLWEDSPPDSANDGNAGGAANPATPPSTGTTPPVVGGSEPSLRVLRVTPASARALTRSRVRVFFSEPVLRRSLGTFSVRLMRHGRRVPVRLTYRPHLHTVTLTPHARLLPGATYRVAVSTRVRDIEGNRLDQSGTAGLQAGTWTFRTRP
jgi:uncharacterized protein DUF4082/Big-like domain-containing protein